MPDLQQAKSEYNQQSFIGGMDLLLDDTHLSSNQYRIGFNLRNRDDRLDPVLSSQIDNIAPAGLKQEMVTFGNYEILFVAGKAYYKFYTDTGWQPVADFQMSPTAPRLWTKAVPLATTNYVRFAGKSALTGAPSASEPIDVNQLAGVGQGNIPGLLVQDNINQPQFIYIDNATLVPVARTTQNFSQWSITFTDANNTTVAPNGDQREYVPIGNVMEFVDGVLYIASQDGNFIYRSVSGRPLDFVIAVSNALVAIAPFTQNGVGDATATSYSVGVGGITCLRAMSDGSLFVAASNANFLVSKNFSNNAPKEFGEYTFIKTFLFNAVCLSDRSIMDSLGDTRFITLTGVRSFNAVEQTKNEGRNLPFAKTIRTALGPANNPIIQDAAFSCCILYDDYELYALQTVFGPAIAVFDTLNQCWSSFDVQQTDGKKIKFFAKIELSVQALFAVTEDDQLYRLYTGPGEDQAEFRSVGICSNILYADQNIKMANPRMEIKPTGVRCIVNRITEDCQCTMQLYVNNRESGQLQTKNIKYNPPVNPSVNEFDLDDVDTMLENILFSTPNAKQGWKTFCVFTWTNGSFTQFSMELNDLTPMNPPNSQT